MNIELVDNIFWTSMIFFIFAQFYIGSKKAEDVRDFVKGFVLGIWAASLAAIVITILIKIWS